MTRATAKSQETLKRDETATLISADKVEGTDVYNKNGDHLGEVEDIMIDKLSGKVAYAVLSFGGFLGIGEERRAIPWSVLHYDTSKDGYVMSASDDIIRQTPSFKSDRDIHDREWGTRLHSHYGVPPYWL